MAMLVKNNDLIEVKVYYKQDGYEFLTLTVQEVEKRIKDKKTTEAQLKEEFELLTVSMAVLSWGTYNDFQSNASKLNEQGERYFDYRTYKEDRLKKLIKAWDAIGEDGKPVLINELTIMSLVPAIGDAIVKGYDEASFYDEESEKK